MRRCRGCNNGELHRILDLGTVPAGDYFPPVDAPLLPAESTHPLVMILCERCGLAQLADDDTIVQEPRGIEPQALRDQAAAAVGLVEDTGWLHGTTALEFGSPHGGSWLPLLTSRGFSLGDQRADLVLDSFGLMHAPDQAAALHQRARCLNPDGVLLLQYHSILTIVEHGQWNALRHGHFAYYSLTALRYLLRRVGLGVAKVWEFDLYGGTVLIAAIPGDDPTPQDPSVQTILEREHAKAITTAAAFRSLQDAADRDATELRDWLQSQAGSRKVFGYGAASRAVALLSRARLDSSLLTAVADASPEKQGRRMPGTDIPIISPAELVAAQPDLVMLTVPDLLPEVSRRFPELDGRWVTELPSPHRARTFTASQRLQSRLHELIPGGAHTYARGSDQYPEGLAPVLRRGHGARVWDVDGNEFVEYGMGLRSVVLGHGYRPVVDAAYAAALDGMSFTRPTELELLAAQDFIELVPGADMVKFAKNGSDVTTAAIRLARAATGRHALALCTQPFFSVDDWFIGTTAMSSGIPDISQHTVQFEYNNLSSLQRCFDSNPDTIAAVIMEAATALAEPEPGFLEGVRSLCDANGTVLIFDEMITGFRWSTGGAQSVYNVTPDLSCWGKAMGNGFAISALAGRRELMELGGLNTDRDRVFLLSTTHGPETTGLAAFRAVVQAYRQGDPIGRMEAIGTQLAAGFNNAAADYGIADFVFAQGRPSCLIFVTRGTDGTPSQAFRTLFLQEMLQRGVLGQSFVVSAAHTDRDISETVAAAHGALEIYRRALDAGSVEGLLSGRPVAPAIRLRANPRRL